MNPFAALLNLLIPRICHICGTQLLDDEEFVCSSCMGSLPLTGFEKYWTNKSGPNTDLNPMEQRFAAQIPLQHACAPYFYSRDTTLASLVHDIKYRNFPGLGTALGRLGAETLLDSGLFAGVEMLLPLPLHWFKKFKRGYNQSEMIARGVSKATGIPIGHHLSARKPHRSQTSLSAEQRRINTKDVFTVNDAGALAGRHVMIIDDICTTGATLLAASEVMTKAVPDIKISLFTIGVVS